MKLKSSKARKHLHPHDTPGAILKRLEALQRHRQKPAESHAKNIAYDLAIRKHFDQVNAKMEADQIRGALPEVRANNPHRHRELQGRLALLERAL